MTHPLTGWRGASGDERHRRLLAVRAHVFGGAFLGAAADLADDDDHLGRRVLVEEAHRIRRRQPDNGVAADPKARRLTETRAAQEVRDLIRERAAAGDEARPTPARSSRRA